MRSRETINGFFDEYASLAGFEFISERSEAIELTWGKYWRFVYHTLKGYHNSTKFIFVTNDMSIVHFVQLVTNIAGHFLQTSAIKLTCPKTSRTSRNQTLNLREITSLLRGSYKCMSASSVIHYESNWICNKRLGQHFKTDKTCIYGLYVRFWYLTLISDPCQKWSVWEKKPSTILVNCSSMNWAARSLAFISLYCKHWFWNPRRHRYRVKGRRFKPIAVGSSQQYIWACA